MLTVEEAARILRIGRTAAYALANRWIDTGGEDGIPARHVGRHIRVPTAELEAFFGIRVTWRRGSLARAQSGPADNSVPHVPDAPEPAKPPVERRRKTAPENQTAFPFAR